MSDQLSLTDPGRAWLAQIRRARNITQCGYWVVDANSNHTWRGIEWVNDPRHEQVIDPVSGVPPFAWTFFGSGKGFDYFKDRPVPRFRVSCSDASKLGEATFFGGSGWIICSRSLADFLRAWQPDGIDILPIEVELKGGHIVPAGDYVFVDVTLRVPTIDAEAMNLAIIDGPTGRFYRPDVGTHFTVRKDIPDTARLFRDQHLPSLIFAADVVIQAYRRQRKWRRLYWRDPSPRPVAC